MSLPQLELVSHHLCPYVQRAVITLLEKNISHQRTYIDLNNKPDWFRQVSPLGKVPLLKVDGEVLFESAVICEYLDEITPGSLHPADPLQRAKHRSWIEFGSNILSTIAGFYNASSPEAFEQKRQELADNFSWIEPHLGNGAYFAGEAFTLVDAVYGPIFRYFDALDAVAELDFFAATPKVQKWRRSLQARPSVQQAVPESYAQQLLTFLKQRSSHLSTLL